MSISGKRGALVLALFSLVFAVYMLAPSGKVIALVIAIAAVPLCACLFIIPSKRKAFAAIAAVLCAASSFAGFFYARYRNGAKSDIESLSDETEHSVVAEVDKVVYDKPFGSAYYLTSQSVDGEQQKLGIYLEIGFSGGFEKGDEISFSSDFSIPAEEDDALLRSKNIFLCAAPDGAELTSKGGALSVFEMINNFFDGVFHGKMSQDEADFASAVFLGNSGNVGNRIKLAFRRCGASHLLALSGLHLAVIVFGIEFLLKALKIRKQIRVVALIISTFGFAVMTGLSASVFRSAVMLALFYFAQLLGEEKDAATSLFFSLALIFIIRPCSVWDAGLWMSFSSTLGLVIFSGALMPAFGQMTRRNYSKSRAFFLKAARYFIGLLTANLVATLFTLPVTYLVFGGVSLISPISNLILVPLVQLILYMLFVFCAVFYIPILSGAVAFICEKLIFLTALAAEKLSAFKGIYISVKYPFAPYLIAGLFICLALTLFARKIKPKCIFCAALALCVSFGGCLFVYSKVTEDELFAVCINEKSSDAIGLVYRGKSFVIDISTGGFAASYEAEKSSGGRAASEIDAYILTHLHTHHIHTLEKLCGYVKINRILLPSAESDSDAEILSQIIPIADENGIEIIFYNRSADSYLDCGDMTVALPEYVTLARSKHPVISFSVSLKGQSVISYAGAGSYEASGETLSGNAYVYIFGSHGPVEKILPESSLFGTETHLIFMSEKTYALSDMPPGCGIVSAHKGKLTLLFKKTK